MKKISYSILLLALLACPFLAIPSKGKSSKKMSIRLDKSNPKKDYAYENKDLRVWINRRQAPKGENKNYLTKIDGRDCWQISMRPDLWPSIYVEMKDKSLIGAGLHLKMELDVYDDNTDEFNLLYDSEYSSRKLIIVPKTASGKWKTFTFDLPDASPNGRVEDGSCDTSSPKESIGASFAINGKLALAAIRVSVIDRYRKVGKAIQTSLDLDFAKVIGPATHKASGLLHSIRIDKPDEKLIKPLKFKCWRTAWTPRFLRNNDFYNKMKRLGLKHLQVSFNDCYPKKKLGYPGDKGNWKPWEDYIRMVIREDIAENREIEYEAWNEPNGGFWKRPRKQFFEAHRRMYNVIRKENPKAVILGPCVAWFDKKFMGAFLDYAHANNCMPDVLTWHELGHGWFGGLHVPEHVEWVKKYMRDRGMPVVKRISLNEIRHSINHNSPGATISHFAGIERTPEVESASNSCWREPRRVGNNGFNDSLDGLLTHDTKQPRSTWWTYKYYADITGNIVEVKRHGLNTPIDGVAGYDVSGDKPVARMLFGWFLPKNKTDLTLNIRNLDKVKGLAANGKVHVKVTRIPFMDYKECKETDLSIMIDKDMKVTKNSLKIILDGSNALLPDEACAVELTPVLK